MSNFLNVPEGTDTIELRKKLSKLYSYARRASKPDRCILCGKQQTSFCNSHSVPQFSLKNIADNGKLLIASAVMDIEIIDTEKGINNSGTFQFICKDCDGTFFQEYESEQNLRLVPSDKMLAEIAVKDFLLQLGKRTQEEALNNRVQQRTAFFENYQDMTEIMSLDIRDFSEEVLFHKAIADNNENGGYQILFWELLPYKVPIALQSAIALTKDLEGNIVNDIYDMSATTRMQFMHLAILPLQTESVVLAFYHKRDKLYRNLRHQINSISKKKALEFINYLIFAYTENYFISNTIKSTIEGNEKLSLLGRENNGFPDLGWLGSNNHYGIDYKPVSMDEIPNFLSSEWAII